MINNTKDQEDKKILVGINENMLGSEWKGNSNDLCKFCNLLEREIEEKYKDFKIYVWPISNEEKNNNFKGTLFENQKMREINIINEFENAIEKSPDKWFENKLEHDIAFFWQSFGAIEKTLELNPSKIHEFDIERMKIMKDKATNIMKIAHENEKLKEKIENLEWELKNKK